MKKFWSFALLVVLTAAAGFAGAPPTVWTGFYVGGHAGYNLGTSNAMTSTVFAPTGYFASSSIPAIAGVGDMALSPNGFGGGLNAGFLYQAGSLVVGIEADFGLTGQNVTSSGTAVYPCCAPTNFTLDQTVKTGWLFTARPRIGLAIDKILIYGTGGLALTNIDYQAVFNDTFAHATEDGAIAQTLTGWTVGGGIEFLAGANFSLKAEVLYTSFGQVSAESTNLHAFTPPIAFPTNVFTHAVDLKGTSIRLGGNFHF